MYLKILRLPLLLAIFLLAACSTLGAVSALLGDSITFTAPQLQGYLDKRFPKDYDKLGGMVRLSVLNPRLSIPPGSSRLRLDFDTGFGVLGSDSRTPAGHVSVSSGLRYDVQQRGLFLDALTLESVDVPQLGGAMNGAGRELVSAWLDDYARKEAVYRLDDGLAEKLAARRIDATTIRDGQVVLQLDQ